jgi:hypothetical protein
LLEWDSLGQEALGQETGVEMRRIILGALAGMGVIALTVSVVLVNQGSVQSVAADSPVNPVAVVTVSDESDNSVTPVAGEAERKIIRTLNAASSLKGGPIEKISELFAESRTKAIITGKVIKADDLFVDGIAYRVLTVEVKSPDDRATASRTRTVTVYEDGGVVPYAEILPMLQEHSDEILPAAGPDEYVDSRFMGAPHSEVGDEIVAFVQPNPNDRDLIPADYQIVGSAVQGLLTKDAKTGEYVRRGLAGDDYSDYEKSLSTAKLTKMLAEPSALAKNVAVSS